MPIDKYGGSEGIDSPSDEFYAVTPDNDNDLPNGVPKGIFVGGAGDIVCVGKDQDPATDSVIFKAAAGTTLPIRPRRILATGTSATNLVALH